MGIFAQRAKGASPAGPVTRAEPPGEPAAELPHGFAAVGEALVAGTESVEACAEAGRVLASAGVSLDEALERLARTTRAVAGTDPDFRSSRALARGWSDATLDYLHQLTCADPVTGLGSQAHLQSRLPELYRRPRRPNPSLTHALVVVDVVPPAAEPEPSLLAVDLAVARLAEVVGSVFVGEPVCRLGRGRVVVLVERDDDLPRRVALVKRLAGTPRGVRTWIEGLPSGQREAATLLGELARG